MGRKPPDRNRMERLLCVNDQRLRLSQLDLMSKGYVLLLSDVNSIWSTDKSGANCTIDDFTVMVKVNRVKGGLKKKSDLTVARGDGVG